MKCYTTIGIPPQDGGPFGDSLPCETRVSHKLDGCKFVQIQDVDPGLATKIWGPLSDTCNYQPGNAATKWTFGCNVGVSPQASVSLVNGPANGWEFANYCYDGNVSDQSTIACQGATGRVSVGRRGPVRLSGRMALPAGFQVKRATIVSRRLLYEPAGAVSGPDELVYGRSGQPLGAVHLTGPRRGGVLASASAAGSRAQLKLGELKAGHRSYDLTVAGVGVSVPDDCLALPASDALATSQFELTSSLRLSNGKRTVTVALPRVWHCVRGRTGTISELRPVAHRQLPSRPGLALSVSGPRTVPAGSTVDFRIRVGNRRQRSRDALISSLWDVAVQGAVAPGGARGFTGRALNRASWRIPLLRRGTARTLRLNVHVPSSSRRRLCVSAAATAGSARSAAATLCFRVRAVTRSPVGLG